MANNDIRGTVTDAQGNPIQGATVSLFLADEASAVRETTTDSNGEYIFDLHPDGTGSSEDWHVAVSYTDANGTQNALSKPFVSASLPDFTFPVAASNLVAWYPFDPSEGARDQTGGVAGVGDPKDYSGTVNGATYQSNGGVTDINSGSSSGAYEFDGFDTLIDLPLDYQIVGNGDEFTVSYWVSFDNKGTWMVSLGEWSDSGTLHSGSDSEGDIFETFVNKDGSITGPSIQYGRLYHTAVTVDYNNQAELFIDGVSEGTLSIGSPSMTQDANIPIGDKEIPATDEQTHDGIVDDVRFYNRVLTASEINQIYQNTAPKVNDATGGSTVTTETIDGQEYKIHAFENTGTSTFTVNDADPGATVDVLIVGGGGGGGESAGGTGGTGGGGAGGVVVAEGTSISSGNHSITVGSGGSGNSNGSDSFFKDLQALGGGAGKGGGQGSGNDGGSGGGTGQNNQSDGETSTGLQPGTNNNTSLNVSNIQDLGNGSLPRFAPNDDGSSAGGGATQSGQTGEYSSGFTGSGYLDSEIPSGGDGFDASNIFGTSFGENGFFGGGGAGGVNYDSGNALNENDPVEPAPGGLGGGGNSGAHPSSFHPATPLAEDGQINTGGGGGGLGSNSNADAQPNGTNGGSGIVLIRYRI